MGLEKLCAPPLPLLLFLCDGPEADLWWWWREGKERSRGAHLHLIALRLLARYKTPSKAEDPADTHTVRDERDEESLCSGSAYYHPSSGKINKATKSCLFLLCVV